MKKSTFSVSRVDMMYDHEWKTDFLSEHLLSLPCSIVGCRSPQRRHYERIQGDWRHQRHCQQWVSVGMRQTGTETWNGQKEDVAFNPTSLMLTGTAEAFTGFGCYRRNRRRVLWAFYTEWSLHTFICAQSQVHTWMFKFKIFWLINWSHIHVNTPNVIST